jgi:uncharacterized protein (DUF305 family)
MLALAAAVGVFAGATLASRAATDSFASAMDASMMRMHEAMSRPGTGDPDHDFAAMMIPHHQGAIEMAEAELCQSALNSFQGTASKTFHFVRLVSAVFCAA